MQVGHHRLKTLTFFRKLLREEESTLEEGIHRRMKINKGETRDLSGSEKKNRKEKEEMNKKKARKIKEVENEGLGEKVQTGQAKQIAFHLFVNSRI